MRAARSTAPQHGAVYTVAFERFSTQRVHATTPSTKHGKRRARRLLSCGPVAGCREQKHVLRLVVV